MFTIPELAAEALGSHLAEHMGRRFGSTDADLIELVQSAARLAIDCIGNSDALYHNVEHTMLVTLVGYDILRGRRLLIETTASDFAHLIFACLFHDIGYVRGILNGDSADGYIVDAKGNKTKLPRGSSDAALMPYHVDRSKLFVLDRMAKIKSLDATRIANAIECHALSVTSWRRRQRQRRRHAGTRGRSHRPARRSALSAQSQCALLRIRRSRDEQATRLCFAGRSHRSLSASSIGTAYQPHIQSAIRYLNVTSSGRQWIANLYSNVFRAERELNLSGPQR